MKLVIGGAYQGKKEYARMHYSDMEIIDRFHDLVLSMVRKDENPLSYVKEHLEELQTKVIICDDISGGIVPLEPVYRKWREELGRTLVFLSEESEEVIRVFCGIGVKIK